MAKGTASTTKGTTSMAKGIIRTTGMIRQNKMK
jgi:hypothetical protein